MTPRRSKSKERQFGRRGMGVMKKADNLEQLIPGIKAAVLFLDGTKLWSYQSEEDWVSTLATMSNIVSMLLDSWIRLIL